MRCLFSQDALDEYNRLKEIKKVGHWFIVDLRPIALALRIHNLPNVFFEDTRLSDEEAPLQVSEGQTEPHQEDGERLRPPGVSDPSRLRCPCEMWQKRQNFDLLRTRGRVRRCGSRRSLHGRQEDSHRADVKRGNYWKGGETKFVCVSLHWIQTVFISADLNTAATPVDTLLLFFFTLLLIVII